MLFWRNNEQSQISQRLWTLFCRDIPLLIRNKKVEIFHNRLDDAIPKLTRKLNSLIEKHDFEACIKVRDSIKIL